MIHSMTAFARRAMQNDWGTAVWEIRSVNHRYLEVTVRLPESLRDLEPGVRERLRQKIQRGKLEVFLKYTPQSAPDNALAINNDAVRKLAQAVQQINQLFPTTSAASVLDILAWPGVLSSADTNYEVMNSVLLQSFDLAVVDLMAVRKKEGEAIDQIISKRLKQILELVATVKQRLPSIMEQQRTKLLARFEEAKINLDAERLEQEMVLLAQKTDICEELERLEIHAKEVQKTLQQQTEAVGRRLDFLMQELHREANTLAAKAIDPETSTVAIELRVVIEQMREQVQNIE